MQAGALRICTGSMNMRTYAPRGRPRSSTHARARGWGATWQPRPEGDTRHKQDSPFERDFAEARDGKLSRAAALPAFAPMALAAAEVVWCGLVARCVPRGRPRCWLRSGASRGADMYLGCRLHVRWARCRAASSSQRHRRSSLLPALPSKHKLQLLLVQSR